MAVKVRWLDGGTYSAEDDRAILQTICAIPGVVNSGDLLVTQHAGGNQTVDVAIGQAFIKGSLGTVPDPQYVYQLGNDTTFSQAIPNADLSLQTNHIIGARVYDDTFDSLGLFKGTLEIVPGVPGAGDPSRPADWLDLARVRQAAGVNTIVNSMIDDLRQRWLPASYMSLGIVADYERITNSPTANSTTEVLVGTVPPFTAIANRYYSVSVLAGLQSTVTNDRTTLRVRDGSTSGTVVGTVSSVEDLANNANTAYAVQRSQFTAGLHTLYLTIQRFNGTGTVTAVGSATAPIQVLVRDEGDV